MYQIYSLYFSIFRESSEKENFSIEDFLSLTHGRRTGSIFLLPIPRVCTKQEQNRYFYKVFSFFRKERKEKNQ